MLLKRLWFDLRRIEMDLDITTVKDHKPLNIARTADVYMSPYWLFDYEDHSNGLNTIRNQERLALWKYFLPKSRRYVQKSIFLAKILNLLNFFKSFVINQECIVMMGLSLESLIAHCWSVSASCGIKSKGKVLDQEMSLSYKRNICLHW